MGLSYKEVIKKTHLRDEARKEKLNLFLQLVKKMNAQNVRATFCLLNRHSNTQRDES